MNTPENNLITIHSSKEITRLYKTFLEILEDLKATHPELLPQEKYEHLRKRVLDNGNECLRQMLGFIECFDFTINPTKVEQAAMQRKVVKKVVISGVTEIR